jgi:hypothetical protein
MMSNVSKPILGLLLSAVVLFAMVMVVFKPHSSTAPNQGAGAYQSAINQAHQAVKTSNGANARLGAPVSTTPASRPAHPAAAHASSAARAAKPAKHVAAAKPAPAGAARAHVAEVERAISQHKVVGLLFYNPSAPDDAAVKAELAAAATRRGVVKMAVPVNEVSNFPMITNTVPVTGTPTLVVIDRGGSASTIGGFADRFEIAQRLNDALSGK